MEMLFRKASWFTNLGIILLVSLVFEVWQFVFLLGIADITDLLANGFGGAIGINIMYVLTSIWREKAYSRVNILCLSATVFVILITYLTL
jgi:glycopeptide antibiotics resistance protein